MSDGAGRSVDVLSVATARRLQAMISEGAFAAGEPMPPQRTLAQSLGVSRTSLREALSMLEAVGVLETRPRRGTFVASAAPEQATPLPGWRFGQMYSAAEVYQFRFVAEGYAARLAAQTADAGDVERLRSNLRSFEQALGDRDIQRIAGLDFEFHRLVMGFSRNRMFADLHASYGSLLQESQRIAFLRKDRFAEPVSEHANIVNAIAHRDADGAGYFMQSHLLRAANRAGIVLDDAIGP
jgi:GntR family transcriptional repressor for pyruvate dehydrogenase complex